MTQLTLFVTAVATFFVAHWAFEPIPYEITLVPWGLVAVVAVVLATLAVQVLLLLKRHKRMRVPRRNERKQSRHRCHTHRLSSLTVTLLSELKDLRQSVARMARVFEPKALVPREALAALDELSAITNMSATMRSLVAARVQESSAHQGSGTSSAVRHVATRTGASASRVAEGIETARGLEQLAATERAARRGELSAEQAALVVKGASADTSEEQRLLHVARDRSLAELKEVVGQVVAAADPDPDRRRNEIHRARSLRSFTDPDGTWHLHVKNSTDVGARIMGTLRPLQEQLFHAARKEGRKETPDRYAADALTEAVCGRDKRSGARMSSPKFIVRLDHQALLRGAAKRGEVMEIAGVGPVSRVALRDLVQTEDPFWAAILTRGNDVLRVAHLGRHPTSFQRTALEWIYPSCAVKGCPNQARIEWDHREEWAKIHETKLTNMDGLCTFHHRLKTTEGWALVEGNGKRDFVPSSDPRHPNRADKHPNKAGKGAPPRAGP